MDYVDVVAVPIWVVLPVLALVAFGIWKIAKLIWIALGG